VVVVVREVDERGMAFHGRTARAVPGLGRIDS
jgi:hypothetical protein